MIERYVGDLLAQFEAGKISRRALVSAITVGVATAAAAPAALAAAPRGRGGFKAVAVNHISYGVADYGRTRDFYAELLGMRVSEDDGTQCALSFGDTFIIPRMSHQPGRKPLVDHIAYTISDWDKEAVEHELKRRGLNPQADSDDSFHIKDPDGYDLQIAGPNMKSAP